MRRVMHRVHCICFIIGAVGLSACSTSPTERSQVVLYSEETMARQGVAAYQQMRDELPLSTNQRELDFARCVTRYIVSALDESERAAYDWEVTVFDSEQANAFALPGGKMGVYNGLFQVAVNQHQLGAVMSHEVGHVLSQHSNERASQATIRSVGMVIAQVAGVSSATLESINLAAELGLFLPFNRTQESEADEVGIMLMARAGFDPRESVRLWENMSAQGGSRPPELLSTHPSPESRTRELGRLMGPAETLRASAMAKGFVPDCRHPNDY